MIKPNRVHTDEEVWLRSMEAGSRIEAADTSVPAPLRTPESTAERVTTFARAVMDRYRDEFVDEDPEREEAEHG